MTEKKRKILESAIALFIEHGYHGASTAKVAKKAGVSEGLIFRHFTNKEGLLDAILKEGQDRIRYEIEAMTAETDPKKRIRLAIESPFTHEEQYYQFWRLQIKIQWELNKFYSEVIEIYGQLLTEAFAQLAYDNPALEAQHLLYTIVSVSEFSISNRLDNPDEFKAFLLSKYDIEDTV